MAPHRSWTGIAGGPSNSCCGCGLSAWSVWSTGARASSRSGVDRSASQRSSRPRNAWPSIPSNRTTPPTPLAALRDPAVDYREGSVEALPCESGHYDLAIIENCIDHVRDMHAGMRELQRALRTGGALYLTVNCRTKWGFVIGDRDPDRIAEYVQEREDALDGAVAMLDRAWAVPTPEGEPETVTKPSPAPEGENWASESDRGAESWEAPEAGLEPATRRLTAGCSTN